jgi:hypothetical protein
MDDERGLLGRWICVSTILFNYEMVQQGDLHSFGGSLTCAIAHKSLFHLMVSPPLWI